MLLQEEDGTTIISPEVGIQLFHYLRLDWTTSSLRLDYLKQSWTTSTLQGEVISSPNHKMFLPGSLCHLRSDQSR